MVEPEWKLLLARVKVIVAGRVQLCLLYEFKKCSSQRIDDALPLHWVGSHLSWSKMFQQALMVRGGFRSKIVMTLEEASFTGSWSSSCSYLSSRSTAGQIQTSRVRKATLAWGGYDNNEVAQQLVFLHIDDLGGRVCEWNGTNTGNLKCLKKLIDQNPGFSLLHRFRLSLLEQIRE